MHVQSMNEYSRMTLVHQKPRPFSGLSNNSKQSANKGTSQGAGAVGSGSQVLTQAAGSASMKNPYINFSQIRPSKNLFVNEEDVETYTTYPPKIEDEINAGGHHSRNKVGGTKTCQSIQEQNVYKNYLRTSNQRESEVSKEVRSEAKSEVKSSCNDYAYIVPHQLNTIAVSSCS